MKQNQKSILFLPFLQIPSGHHQAAHSLIEGIRSICPEIHCDKVDILSYSYGKIESLVSNIYLKWIHLFPGMYHFIYKSSVCKNIEKHKRYRLYEILFIYFTKRLIEEKKPDLIVCTHALPAYMLNYMKKKNKLDVPVINVYTDYFIHRFWGIEQVDYHFVPCEEMKHFLLNKGIKDDQIFTTGIPIHSKISKINYPPSSTKKENLILLISGGNLGVGAIEALIESLIEVNSDIHVTYYVLCGKNNTLYEKLKALSVNYIVPFPYIECRKKMNDLYEEIDGILTKPGGVTISESLFKRKPIFIYDALPGQEEINLKQLKDMGLVFHLDKGNVQEQVIRILQNRYQLEQYQNHVSTFHSYIHSKEPAEIIADIFALKKTQ